jgi:hypothetical protein
MNQRSLPEWAGRAIACFLGAIVLALMVGPQQGSRSDYGLTFREQVLSPRIVAFLVVGALVFLAVTYQDIVRRYASRPGVRPLIAGTLVLLASYFLMHWYDPLGNNGKFAGFADAVAGTSGIAPLATIFFGWLWWVSLVVLVIAIFVAIARRLRWLGWAAAGFAVVMGVIALLAHATAASAGGGIDHSFGAQAAFVGYLILASAGVIAARSQAETAATREFVERVMAFRPGLPLVVMGLVLGVLALTVATWFAPQRNNATLADTSSLFSGSSATGLTQALLSWLAYVLFVVVLLVGAAAVWTGRRALGYATMVVAAVAILLTVVTLHDISATAFKAGAGAGPWQDLGTGGWLFCIALFSIGAGGFVAARRAPATSRTERADEPMDADSRIAGRLHQMGASTTALSIGLFGVGLALFYPPTATSFWQQALVTDIGVYVMLAVGLNVVIGWAGLLDLGVVASLAAVGDPRRDRDLPARGCHPGRADTAPAR